MSSEDVTSRYGGKLVVFFRGGRFSGCVVRADLIEKGVKVREEFFLDQADFDFYGKIRRLGFLTVLYCEKLIDHKLGLRLRLSKIRLPFIGSVDEYEPPWRYYYIVRNSTVLLMEGEVSVVRYIKQLVKYALALVLVDGLHKTLKALILGLAHGLFRKLGYIDPREVGILSSLFQDRLSHYTFTSTKAS